MVRVSVGPVWLSRDGAKTDIVKEFFTEHRSLRLFGLGRTHGG